MIFQPTRNGVSQEGSQQKRNRERSLRCTENRAACIVFWAFVDTAAWPIIAFWLKALTARGSNMSREIRIREQRSEVGGRRSEAGRRTMDEGRGKRARCRKSEVGGWTKDDGWGKMDERSILSHFFTGPASYPQYNLSSMAWKYLKIDTFPRWFYRVFLFWQENPGMLLWKMKDLYHK